MKDEDKTKKQLIEELKELRQKTSALEKAMELIKVGVTLADLKGNILYTNYAESQMHGYKIEELIGRKAHMLAPKYLWGSSEKINPEDVRNWKRETINVRKDGTIFPVQLLSNVVTDDEGKSLGIVTICDYVGEKKAHRETIVESEQKFRAIVENADAIVFALSPEGVLTYASPKFEDHLGYQPSELEGRLFEEFIHPEDLNYIRSFFERHSQNDDMPLNGLEYRIKEKNGSWKWYTLNASCVRGIDESLLYYICVGHDISERVRAEEELRIALIETIKETENQRMIANEASKLKSELLGIAAHDLKNPLTSIMGFADLILVQPEKSELIENAAKLISDSSRRMLNLIVDLLQTSVIDSGNMDLNKKKFDMARLIDGIVQNQRKLAARKEQKIFYSHEEDLTVIADESKMEEIVTNLISNAIKYSPLGKNIWVSVRRVDWEILFEVKDEGPGLTENDKRNLFKRFQRLSAQPTAGESSTGLGLSIVKQFVELHSGDVGVSTKLGKGSTFYFTIPIGTYDKAEI